MNTRRQFLIRAPIGLLGAAAACSGDRPAPAGGAPQATPGAPPAFGTAAGAGPEVSPSTFAEAEKLAQVNMSAGQREMAAATWRKTMAPYLERRSGPRKVTLGPDHAPAMRWNPALVGSPTGPDRDHFTLSRTETPPLPANDADIAFAPVTSLARWIESRKLSPTRLTWIYLDRIARLDPKLRSVITLARAEALGRAAMADAEIASGKYRGPLHGIPFGVKDLLDTAGIATTYGAEPFRDRAASLGGYDVANTGAVVFNARR